MGKIAKIDFDGDRLIPLAADLVDEHKYFEALKILNKNGELNGNDADSFMLYAEIYDDLGLHEMCVNGWFRYMDEADFTDMSDCYEGLAVSFMNLGNEQDAAYYYKKLLSESDGVDPQTREEIINEFMSESDNPLKFSYPPELEDCSEYIAAGIEHMKTGDYELAIADFENVSEGNKKYLAARNYMAMCKIIADRTDEAEQECLNVLEKFPDDVQALTTLAAVKTEAGKSEEALALAKKLAAANTDDEDEIYKIATVCCENKLHKEAFNLFKKLTGELCFDQNIMYFKAVSAFNCGKAEESFAAFDELCTLYPDAVTARYYYRLAKGLYERGESMELSYFYRLPSELRESSFKVLAAYVRLSKSSAKKLAMQIDLSECVKWCFDEIEGGGSGELRRLAAQAAVKAGLDDIVRGILLDAFEDDGLKMEVLTMLVERNEFDCFGLVLCNCYRRLTTARLDIGRAKRKNFIKSYAQLVAHFALADEANGVLFAEAAERLYKKLESEKKLDCAADKNALNAAIYILSGVKFSSVDGDGIYGFFATDEKKVKNLLGESLTTLL